MFRGSQNLLNLITGRALSKATGRLIILRHGQLSVPRLNRVQSAKPEGAPEKAGKDPQNLAQLLTRITAKKDNHAPQNDETEADSNPAPPEGSYVDLTLAIESRKKAAFIEEAPALGAVDLDQLEKLTREKTQSKPGKRASRGEFLELPPAI